MNKEIILQNLLKTKEKLEIIEGRTDDGAISVMANEGLDYIESAMDELNN